MNIFYRSLSVLCLMLCCQLTSLAEGLDSLVAVNDLQYYAQLDLSKQSNSSKKKTSSSLEQLLVGLVVNGKEVSSIEIIKSVDQYLIPIELLFPRISVSHKMEADNIVISTPTGQVSIAKSKALEANNMLWLGLDTLNQHLLVNGRFDQTRYAVSFVPPWFEQRGDLKMPDNWPPITIDFKPKPFSLKQIRVSSEVSNNNSSDYSNDIEVLATGAAVGGSWRFEAEKDDNGDWQLKDYYWLKRDNKQQWLVGKQTVAPSVVADPLTLTGLQYFYSSVDIPYDSYEDISQSNFFQRLGNSIKGFKGNASAGALAQLYIEGELLKEVYVNLDGSYDFGDVQLRSGFFNDVEIVFRDPVTRAIIERQNKTSANADYLLDAGQHIAGVALGQKGNLLDEDEDRSQNVGDEVAMLLYRYGFNDKVTVEVGYVSDDISNTTAGISSSLGKNFVGAFRVADSDNKKVTQLEIDGYGEKWRFSSNVRRQRTESIDPEIRSKDETSASSNVYYDMNPSLRLELIGRYQNTENERRFIKPGFSYSPNHQLSISARPDYNGDYRSDVVYQPNNDVNARFTHTNDEENIRLDWRINNHSSSYFSARRYKTSAFSALDIDDRPNLNHQSVEEYAIGYYWRPDYLDSYGYLRLEANYSDFDGLGAYAEYRTRILPGVYFDLTLQDSSEGTDDDFLLSAKITIDFASSGGRFIPSRSFSSHNTDGVIAGRLMTDSQECNINQASILVNGYAHIADVQGCDFYLPKIKPGIYQIEMANEFLPIELIPEGKAYTVKVSPSAVTNVNFSLSSEYSAAGQVIDQENQAVVNAKVTLRDIHGVVMMVTMSDQFGYFRVDGLARGRYQLEASYKPKKQTETVLVTPAVTPVLVFDIEDDFLFGLNLKFANPNG